MTECLDDLHFVNAVVEIFCSIEHEVGAEGTKHAFNLCHCYGSVYVVINVVTQVYISCNALRFRLSFFISIRKDHKRSSHLQLLQQVIVIESV